MKNKFTLVFGSFFEQQSLECLLSEMCDEEILYWFAKCGGKRGWRGRRAFSILFGVPLQKRHLTKRAVDDGYAHRLQA